MTCTSLFFLVHYIICKFYKSSLIDILQKLKRPEKSVFLLCFEFLSIVKIYTPTTSADELSGQFSFFVISSLSFTRLSISSSKVLMSLN